MDDFYLFQGLCTGGGVDPGNLAFSVPVNSGLDLSRSLSYNSLDNTVWRYDLEMLIIRKYFSRDLRVWDGTWALGWWTEQAGPWAEECSECASERCGASGSGREWYEALLRTLPDESSCSERGRVLHHVRAVEDLLREVLPVDRRISPLRASQGDPLKKKNYPVISLLSLPNDLKASNSETSQLNFNPRSGRLGKCLWLPIDLKAWWLCWWRFGFTLYIYLVLTGIGVMPLQVLVPQLHPLADQQFVDVCNLRQSCQQAEDALSQGMDKLQQNLAETVAFGHMGDGAFLPPMAQAVEKLEALVSFVNQVVPPVTPTCVFTRELFNQDETSNICLRTVIRLIIFGKRLCCRCLES